MKTFHLRSEVGWGMHVVPEISDYEEERFFSPPLPGEDRFGAMAFQRMLEAIRVPQDRSRINTPGWVGDTQLIDYKRTWVEVKFAELCVGDIKAFDPFWTIPHTYEEAREEVYLLDPLGKPIGYVRPWKWEGPPSLKQRAESPIDRIFALRVPRLLKYVLWLSHSRRSRAGLFILDGNKSFEKMLEVYATIDPPFCRRVRELIAKRAARNR